MLKHNQPCMFDELALGARFKYALSPAAQEYVVLERHGNGQVCHYQPDGRATPLQGIFGAFDSVAERSRGQVYYVGPEADRQSAAPVGVPPGYALVPIKPTDDMVVAFAEAWFMKTRCFDDPEMDDAYAAMLAAAATPPAQATAAAPDGEDEASYRANIAAFDAKMADPLQKALSERAATPPDLSAIRDEVLNEAANHLVDARWTRAAECVRALRSQPEQEGGAA